MFDALARLADRHARRVGLIAIAFFILAGVFGGSVASHLAPYGDDDPATESSRADTLLEDAGYRATGVVVLIRGGRVAEPPFAAKVKRIERQLVARRDVAAVSGYYDTRSAAFVSRRDDATYLAVQLRPTGDREIQDSAKSIDESLASIPGVTVGGRALAQEQVNKQVERDLRVAEMLAFPLLFLLSLLFFRSLVAALLPLMVGVLAIVGTFLALRIGSEVGSISVFALNLTTGLGLGLAIDYSLFIVSRYREEIAKDGPGLGAMRRTMATAGRTVLFSSLTVAAAIASLIVFPQRFLYSMGIGGACVALIAAAVSLTVLPAVLTMLGTRVNSLSPRFLRRRAERETSVVTDGFWYRLSRFVMRRPIPIATITAAALIALGLPFLGIKFNSVDSRVLPRSASARQVDAALRSEFPPFRTTPIVVAVQGGGRAAPGRMEDRLARVPGVSAVNPPQRLEPKAGGDRGDRRQPAGLRPRPRHRRADPQPAAAPRRPGPGDRRRRLVRRSPVEPEEPPPSGLGDRRPRHLRGPIPDDRFGRAPGQVAADERAQPERRLRAARPDLPAGAVRGPSSATAATGGSSRRCRSFSSPSPSGSRPITPSSCCRGSRRPATAGASESECVAIGLERTGRIVTAAALLFAIAIGAFATSEVVFIKENGVGTALAVLIDATIIRALLVPSLMELLGKWNWWAPAPLRRLHRRIGISEPARRRHPEGGVEATAGGAG